MDYRFGPSSTKAFERSCSQVRVAELLPFCIPSSSIARKALVELPRARGLSRSWEMSTYRSSSLNVLREQWLEGRGEEF